MASKKELKQQVAESLSLGRFKTSEQDKIIKILMDNISARINIAVMDRLDESEKKEFGNLLKSKKKSGVLKYVNSKIKDFSLVAEKIAEETVQDFKKIRGI